MVSEPLGLAALHVRRARAIEETANDILSVEELGAAIGAFSPLDAARLRKAARLLSGGTDLDEQDLYQEAVVRALSGTRTCPRTVEPRIFLTNAMRSIATESRKGIARHAPVTSLAATGTEGVVVTIPDPTPSAEEFRISRDYCATALAAIDTLFADDEEALMVILGDIDGLDAEAIREMQGWDKNQLATVRRRIRRRIEQAYPKGLPA